MSSMAMEAIILVSVFGGALVGMLLRAVLPERHLCAETRDVLKLGTGLVGTMAALVLGLLLSAAKGAYDTQKDEVTSMSADVLMLDRVLAHYGPEAKGAREALRRACAGAIDRLWTDTAPPSQAAPISPDANALFDTIQGLAPTDEAQRGLRAEALRICGDLGRMRLLLFQQKGTSIYTPVLIALTFWLVIIFISFGLFAPPHATAIATLFLCALSVSSAIYLILELDRPFTGLIRIPSTLMESALAHLGQ